LLTALLTVTFTRNQDKKTEKFFLLKANFVRNFSPLENNNFRLGDELLPAPLCIFNALFFTLRRLRLPVLSDSLLFFVDFILTVMVVIPCCWVVVVFLIVNRWDECTCKIQQNLHLQSFFCSWYQSKWNEINVLEQAIAHALCFCSVVTSPLWFPCLVIMKARPFDWRRPSPYKYESVSGDTTQGDLSDDVTQTGSTKELVVAKNGWMPALQEKMTRLLEIFQTKTEKGEGLYWISKEVNRDGLLQEIFANNDKNISETSKLLEDMKDKFDAKLATLLGEVKDKGSQSEQTKLLEEMKDKFDERLAMLLEEVKDKGNQSDQTNLLEAMKDKFDERLGKVEAQFGQQSMLLEQLKESEPSKLLEDMKDKFDQRLGKVEAQFGQQSMLLEELKDKIDITLEKMELQLANILNVNTQPVS